MSLLSFKKMYVTSMIIVGIVIYLLIFIIFSTYQNLNRDKTTALKFMYEKGLATLNLIEAFTVLHIAHSKSGPERISPIFKKISQVNDIAYICLINKNKKILYHTDNSQIGAILSRKFELNPDRKGNAHLITNSKGIAVYEVYKRFDPFENVSDIMASEGMLPRIKQTFLKKYGETILAIGFHLSVLDTARKMDIQHAWVMIAILVALGLAALFFSRVIQNYYSVNKKLEQNQEYTNQVVAHMANGLISIHPDGRIVSYNRLAIELLGLDEKDVKDRRLHEIIDCKQTNIQEVLFEAKSIIDLEYYHLQHSLEKVPLSFSATPIPGKDGPPRGAVVLLRDLREIKKLEEKVKLAERQAAIGKMAASVAHEIRNPLSSIRGFAKFLHHALSDTPREREYAEIMILEIDRINRVVTDLLSYSRPMTPEFKPANIADLIDHGLRLVEADAKEKQIKIIKQLQPDLPLLALDFHQMTQVLLNLFLNALNVLETDHEIIVSAELTPDKTFFDLFIEDNGPGIPQEHIAKVMDPFFTTKSQGTGLGLAIVHKIIETHRGTIDIQSPPPNKTSGTRCSIRIPVNGNSDLAG